MTKELANVKSIMEVAKLGHKKAIEYYEESLKKDWEEEETIRHLKVSLYVERELLKEVVSLMHEMEVDGLWE